MIKFQKFQGTGNDFIILTANDLNGIDYSELAKKICNRHYGIGADGMIIVEESSLADVKMCFYNADGSTAAMCGNGIRCFSKFVYENNLVDKTEFEVETLAGTMKVEATTEDNKERSIKINLGKPIFSTKEIPKDKNTEHYINKELTICDERFKISSIFIGTIHTVLFVKDFENMNFKRIGKLIENDRIFPVKTNVNFCRVIDKENIEVLTWERGVGITLACGTGAAAAAVVSSIIYDCSKKVRVKSKGGFIIIEERDGEIYMTGPAELICIGEYNFIN